MKERKQIYSGTLNPEISKREVAHGHLARRLAIEGMVLLKNEELLPLNLSVPIALLGSGAARTVKGGIGSGDVNNRHSVSIYEGMKEAGANLVNEEWLRDYDKCYEAARNEWKAKILEEVKHVNNPFVAYSANPFVLPEGRRLIADDIKEAEVAVYVISRISGEGKDRRAIEGDYYLSEREQEELLYLNEKKVPTVLIINAGGPVELTDILEKTECIKSILNISQPGQEGGHAVADVLFGKAVPGGRLTATWARHYEDYPYADSFGYLNGNLEKEEYKEGIYVGYRYFDSFDVKPLFPFGYGLSYTSFDMEFRELRIKENSIEVDITVKNIGECYVGREVVQVYVTLPQMGRTREYHRLAGFAKTVALHPKESQTVTIEIEQKQIASFSEEMHAWIVEKGEYGIWIGENSASLLLAAILNVPKEVVIERTHSVCPKKVEFKELDREVLVEDKAIDWFKNAKEMGVPEYTFVPGKEKIREYQSQFVTEYTVTELIPLLYGNITGGASTLGAAGRKVPGSAGETTGALEENYGIRSLIMADGPAGLRLRQSYEVDRQNGNIYGVGVLGSLENGFLETKEHHQGADTYYQYCTAFPVGTALAQTWDEKLLKEFGEAIAVEMNEFHVDLWLAPGMNIHRNPLCGRNFEYYSEDPLLSGLMAAAVTTGVQSQKGCGVTIKHFACNNQEDNRMGVDVCVSERALREIYLRGFEIVVKKSAPLAIMTSYNLINGVHAANSKDLCMVLARKEWGFDGVIMSDWDTTSPEDGSIPWQCVAAGNDIIMPGNTEDDKNIREAYEKNMISEDDIRSCAGRIIALVNRLEQ